MSARRLKLALIVGGLLFGALSIIAWTQPWFGLTLTDGQHLEVLGQVAAPALSALGLASVALAAALSIAGRVLRTILGVVQAAIGALVMLAALGAVGDPPAASAQTVTAATAISGRDSIAALVSTVTATAWPGVAIVVGGLSAVVGLAVVVSASRWPGPTRKYEVVPHDDGATTVGAWDALSDGRDPTTPFSR